MKELGKIRNLEWSQPTMNGFYLNYFLMNVFDKKKTMPEIYLKLTTQNMHLRILNHLTMMKRLACIEKNFLAFSINVEINFFPSR